MKTSTSPASVNGGASTVPFRSPGFEGELNQTWRPVDLDAAVAKLTDPGNALETLHWGRNYLYTLVLDTGGGEIEVVVKQFRNHGLMARLKRRVGGSKATRSWRAAWKLRAAAIATPEPILLAESTEPDGPSYYVCRRLSDFFESRCFFRALIAGTEAELFPQVDSDRLIAALGETCRRLHEAGVWHRDISIGNLLVQIEGPDRTPRITCIDLNRARLGRRLGLWRRTRDLCRLPFPTRSHRERFLSSYWNRAVSKRSSRYALFWSLQQGFLFKNRTKQTLRRPLDTLKRLLRSRRAYAHIPAAPDGASARDKIVWDHLSDQPHQHATRGQRARVRLADAAAHGEALAAVLSAAPRTWWRYRQLSAELFRAPVRLDGIGVALRPQSENPESLLSALEETGVRKVLLRLHPWEADHRAEQELATELHRRGYELAFALPQNRDLVRDLERWSAAVEELAESFTPFGRHFQIGQAINRSKWGVWTYREYLDLAARASQILRRRSDVKILGPAVIDFEFQATAAVLNMRREDVHFDVVSSLLYVDRRGAPENSQLGFDSVGKAALLKAIAETGKNCDGKCWVTEVNWPLWEGPHSPAGRSVSVDEDTQADYLVRYYLQVLASGMVDRVYWWQLAARGYGLTVSESDGSHRRRPSHRALAQLVRSLGGTTFEEKLPAPPGVWLLRFVAEGEPDTVVGWTVTEPATVELSHAVRAVVDRDGAILAHGATPSVELGRSPRYFSLET